MTRFLFSSTGSLCPHPGAATARPRPNPAAGCRADPSEFGDVTADTADQTATGDATAAGDGGTHAAGQAAEGADVPAATAGSSSRTSASTGRVTASESTAIHPAYDTAGSGTAAPSGAEHH